MYLAFWIRRDEIACDSVFFYAIKLVQDHLSIAHVFLARLYGLRSYQKVIRDVALQKDTPPSE